MTDKKNSGLVSAKRPNQRRHGNYTNDIVSNISSLCSVCGGDHNVIVIQLENGGHIITRPFSKEKATKLNVTDGKRRAARLDLVNVFWPSDEGSV